MAIKGHKERALLRRGHHIQEALKRRVNINNDKLLSLNSIFSISKSIKLKTIGFINKTETNFFKNSIQQFVNINNSFTRKEDLAAMLSVIGVNSLDELIDKTVPSNIRLKQPLNTGAPMSEQEFLTELKGVASKNEIFTNYIGMGYYNTLTPTVVLRNIMENPGWYTAYTPYQAEIAQGRLEALLNFQTLVIELSGMEIANGSLLDEATAAAEAMNMFKGLLDRKRVANKYFVDQHTFPQTIDVLYTRAQPVGIEIVIGDFKTFTPDDSYFGAMVQYPNNVGSIEDYREFTAKCKAANVKTCFASDLMALTLLTPPGDFGADCDLVGQRAASAQRHIQAYAPAHGHPYYGDQSDV